jgi:tetratricopeptide (TPR) repeat protein
MAGLSTRSLVGNRYELQNRLGAGAMGEVYRATDRLTGHAIALKRVTIPSNELEFASRMTMGVGGDVQLALAQEFRTLATLRHPNIISVLDYGFDEERRPYFTMDLLGDSESLVKAAQGQSVETQIGLLIQALEALTYLHRRGILHRDLKPANVLVANQKVRVLDFGLATTVGHTEGVGGTLPYMAPEAFRQERIGPGLDLYAVGIMAYEMLTERYPFNTASAQVLIRDILFAIPDTSDIPNQALAAVVSRLLEKKTEDRYGSAREVTIALAEAIGQPPPQESVAIRESFLQAAGFVGRDVELSHLTDALQSVRDGEGSAWLVAGESGVGKSRLMDELRIQALVSGIQVMHGQAVDGSGLPFQLWRDIGQQLLLSTPDVSEFEASVLKEIVPTIQTILEYAVEDAPPVISGSNEQRMARVLVDMIQRQSAPILLLLDDLQWSQESLVALKMLAATVGDFPILIVGSYRTDEDVQVKDELVEMQVIVLERLNAEEISTLSQLMLGENAHLENVTDYLYQETEGNVFFVVEMLRALAEQSGGLATIGARTLPSHLLAGGIQQVVERRLARLPDDDFRVLELAAVAGRDLDLSLIGAIVDHRIDIEGWLYRCADAMVLEVNEHRWRFNHDKLREALLLNLVEDRSFELHGQVGAAIEDIYQDDLRQHAEVLIYHWNKARNDAKEFEAILRYVDIRMIGQLRFSGTSDFFDRAYELFERIDVAIEARIELLYLRSLHLSDPDDIRQAAIHEALRLAEDINNPYWVAMCKYGMSRYVQNPEQHYELGLAAVDIFQQLGDDEKVLMVEVRLVASLLKLERYEEAEAKGLEILNDVKDLGDHRMYTDLLVRLSIIVGAQKKLDEKLYYLDLVKELAIQANDLGLLASNMVNRGALYESMNEFEKAIAETLVALDLFEKTGNISGIGTCYANLLSFYVHLERWSDVGLYGREALEFGRERGVRWSLHVFYLQEMARSGWHTGRQGDAQILLGALQQDGMTPEQMYKVRLEELEGLIRPVDPDLVEIGANFSHEEMVAFALDEWSPKDAGGV